MAHGSMPDLVVFDVNETLSDMSPLGAAFEQVGLPATGVEGWFAGLLRDGFALTSVGVRPSFADLAGDSLRRRLLACDADGTDLEAAVGAVMGTFSGLDVHPDVGEGVRALHGAGVRLVTLSNGSTSVAEALLERADLTDAFERLLSVDQADAWKPDAAAYAYALAECGVEPDHAMLVAVHPWDIDGAARAGLRTGWLNRAGTPYPTYFTTAEVEAPDLVGLARALA